MSKPLLELTDSTDGFNIIIDARWAAHFPMELGAQVALLVENVNRAHEDRMRSLKGTTL